MAEETNLDFYRVAATIIPLLFVALAFQLRRGPFVAPLLEDELQRRLSGGEAIYDHKRAEMERYIRRERAVAAGLSLLAMLVLVVGESLALSVLAEGAPTGSSETVVALALLLGSLLVLFPLVEEQVERLGGSYRWFEQHKYAVTWGGSAAMLVIATLWWP